MEKMIILRKNVNIIDKDGKVHLCTVKLQAKSFIPDVYVSSRNRIGERYLYDDDVFVQNVIKVLRKLGYTGPEFGRAELGIQGIYFIVLEPDREFWKWAKQKGWVDLDETDRHK